MLARLIKISLALFFSLLPFTAGAASDAPRGFNDSFTLKFQEQTFELPAADIFAARGSFSLPMSSNLIYKPATKDELARSFFGQGGKNPVKENQNFQYSPNKIYDFVQTAINGIEKPAQEPSIKIQDNRAVEFTPPTDGVGVDVLGTTLDVLKRLEENVKESTIIYSTTSPKTLLSNLNNLGINELIARGASNFKGSPKNRRHNISVGVEKFKGVIIQQGEEFSFNTHLGPVEEEQGFLPELVIKASGTIPELGGGLCQVSSTTFRAAMNAGLPITQRKNHSYAVQYYAPQGTDATIYPGVIDLKFINDTQGAILVWPHFLSKDDLVFDFYGTKDNRQVTLEKPRQYDRKSDGSMKAEWTRMVTKNGVTSSSTFKSIYLPPALFHKQEEFVTAAPPPVTTPILQIPQTN